MANRFVPVTILWSRLIKTRDGREVRLRMDPKSPANSRTGRKFDFIEMPAVSLPVIEEADVIVVGGGTAGFIAATASARTGAKTILVERWGYLGGCSTAPYNTGINKFGDTDGNQVI